MALRTRENSRSSAGAVTVRLLIPVAGLACVGLAMWATADVPPVPVPPQNPITEEKRVLGKILFWDEQLSSNNAVACATCHTPLRGGSDNRSLPNPGPDHLTPTPDDRQASPGVPRSDADMNFLRDAVFGTQVQVTDRAAPSAINAAFAPNLFWDGRASGQFRDPLTNQVLIQQGGALESQSVNPPVSPAEMAHDGINWGEIAGKLGAVKPLELATNNPADVAAALAGGVDYPELFRRAFGTPEITPARIAFAIATYERTLIADQTPFDRFRAGQQGALTPGQVQGFNQMQNHRCTACHAINNDLFTDFSFRNVGLRPPTEDLGRQIVTGNPGDRGRFKVPGLRNVGLKRSFMHNGQFSTLTDVIRFYARAPGAPVQFPDNRDPLMNQIVPLPPQDAQVIQDFLQNGLTDPRVAAQTFPFDHPTLATDRAGTRGAHFANGTPGSGGVTPRIIADMPSMIGTTNFRVGIDGALGNAHARLVMSSALPVGGRVSPDATLAEVTASGAGAGGGLGTAHFYLSPRRFTGNQTVYMQWLVADAGAAGGEALSEVFRFTMFCGASGCPTVCPADFNDDGFVDFFDTDSFFDCFMGGACAEGRTADFNGDGFVDFFDADGFTEAFERGC